MITIGWGVWKMDLIAGLGLAIGAEAVNEQSNGQSALEVSDAAAAAVAVAPRVTLADIEGAICARYDMTADKAMEQSLLRLLWCIAHGNGGRIDIERRALEDFPGDDRAIVIEGKNTVTGVVYVEAQILARASAAPER